MRKFAHNYFEAALYGFCNLAQGNYLLRLI